MKEDLKTMGAWVLQFIAMGVEGSKQQRIPDGVNSFARDFPRAFQFIAMGCGGS